MPPAVLATNKEDLTIEFIQMPHSPIELKITWAAIANNTRDYFFKIRENGVLGRDAAKCTDDALGKVFNPLTEIDKYGRENPFADPSRGVISEIEGPAANDVFYR